MAVISLCGFMGAGKTTIGKNLARYMGYKFIDLDWYLEEKFGESVANYFDKYGEASFREQEVLALMEIITDYKDSKGLVLALGGGALTNVQSANVIKESTVCVYLNCDNKTLLKRLLKSDTERPLLAGKSVSDLEQFIELKKLEREGAYMSSSKIVVDIIEGDKIVDILDKIFNKLPIGLK